MYLLNTSDVLRIVQITDTHLNATEEGHLLGMETLHSLHCVLNVAVMEQVAPHGILVTGDLSQDGSLASYQRLAEALSCFSCPAFWIPGNHDEPDVMSQVIAGTDSVKRLIRSTHWQIVLLNSSVKGKVHGYLSDEEMLFAKTCIEERPDLHTLVSFHHHPVAMGSRWIDTIGVRNGSDVMEALSMYSNVRCLLWGHVHQESDHMQGHIRMLSTPSTCVQFTPGSENFDVDTCSPGYRWLDLHPDGTIDTGVRRVQGIDFEIDYSVKGY